MTTLRRIRATLLVEGAGGTADLTVPSEPGTYAVHCEIHSTMTGELTVS